LLAEPKNVGEIEISSRSIGNVTPVPPNPNPQKNHIEKFPLPLIKEKIKLFGLKNFLCLTNASCFNMV